MSMITRRVKTVALATGLALVSTQMAQAADAVRIALIEVMSGPAASVGDQYNKQLQFIADRINADGGINGVPLEITAFDNKMNPQESLALVDRAIDEGYDFVAQGASTAIAHAISGAVKKHNKRNPEQPLGYLNYAALDPALTNDKCNYWHFRFDAHVDIRMAALAEVARQNKDIKKVYLINQDYGFGRAVAASAKKMLKEARPDIEFVGEDLIPILKTQDFSPYNAKIKASGADTVITGNWGGDLTRMLKNANDSDMDIRWLTFFAGGFGVPDVLGEGSVNRVRQISEWHENMPNADVEAWTSDYAAKHEGIRFATLRLNTMLQLVKKAAEKAGKNDAASIAAALEGLEIETGFGKAVMRKDDHQLFQPMALSIWSKDVKTDITSNKAGLGFATEASLSAAETMVPTSCQMQRP